MWENNFLKQNSQHKELCKTGDYVKTGKKTVRYQKKNTMELLKRNLCRSKHKYELKLKIKGTKGSKTQQIQNKHLDQNQETNKPNKVLWKNMTRQNT